MPVRSARKKTSSRKPHTYQKKPGRATMRNKRASHKTRRSSSNRSYARNYFILFVLFICSFIILSGGIVYRYLYKSIASAFDGSPQSYSRKSLRDLQFPSVLYIVVDDLNSDPLTPRKLEYKVFNRSSHKYISFEIPLDLKVDAPGKFNEESLRSFPVLGSLSSTNHLKGSAEFLASGVFKLTASRPYFYMIVDNDLKGFMDDYWSKGSYSSLIKRDALLSFNSSFYTNLTPADFFEFGKLVKSYEEDGSYTLESGVSFDKIFRDFTLDSKFRNANVTMAVLNASEVPGLASFGSRVLSNYGGHVIHVGNANEMHHTSVIIAKDITASEVVEISHMFGISRVVSLSQRSPSFNEDIFDRADIILVLGVDIGMSF